MKGDEKKFHNYSLSFYQKEKALHEVSNRAKLGFDNFQRHDKILKPRTADLFVEFNNRNKEGQKELLREESEGHMEALFDIVKALNSNRELMEFVLPTIDAILSEESRILRELVANIKENKGLNITGQLRSILAVDGHEPATYEAAARVLSLILGELPKETHFNEQKNLVLELMQIRRFL